MNFMEGLFYGFYLCSILWMLHQYNQYKAKKNIFDFKKWNNAINIELDREGVTVIAVITSTSRLGGPDDSWPIARFHFIYMGSNWVGKVEWNGTLFCRYNKIRTGDSVVIKILPYNPCIFMMIDYESVYFNNKSLESKICFCSD